MKKEIKDYIIQVILIVFSVVLGLYLNKKIEQHNERKEVEKLFSIVKSELTQNRHLLLEWHPYHAEIRDDFKALLKDKTSLEDFVKDRETLFDALFTKGTFMKRMPSDNAWEMAKTNPIITNIGYDKMLLLSKTYDQQVSTFEPAKEMFTLYHSTDVNLAKNAQVNLEIMQNYMHELVGREILLLEYYEQAVEEFNLEK